MSAPTVLAPGLWAIDTGYIGPQIDAVHVLLADGEVALIDSGVGSTAPVVLEGLAALGIAPAQVRHLVLTHVHLDHAGGAGALMAALPRAQLVVHPRGARHMIDPTRLVAGSVAVYGAELFAQLYGVVSGVPAERLRSTVDGEALALGRRALRVLHTPGHAKHHQCVLDEELGAIFTGDTFGLAYPRLVDRGRPFPMATTTPIDFDPGALHSSIDRIAGSGATFACLTHFGRLDGLAAAAEALHADVDAMVRLCAATAEQGEQALADAILDWWVGRLRAAGHSGDEGGWHEALQLDAPLNAQGLLHWWSSGGRPA
ncbi:MAG: MBL fold metallo-hydrolase [Deltaproteobacteria bacterium]|nr:MBL fold metallo-hydrolase [Deltaproteobacteria bacterium]